MDKRELIEKCRESDVKFVRLVFTELYGHLRNVSIPVEELDKALNNELMFDGSRPRPLRAFASGEDSHVIHIGSVSKTLAPGSTSAE